MVQQGQTPLIQAGRLPEATLLKPDSFHCLTAPAYWVNTVEMNFDRDPRKNNRGQTELTPFGSEVSCRHFPALA